MNLCTDNEFHFVLNDTKLQKLAPKVWKSKDCSVDEPLLTFHFRVQYYVDNIGLLKCVLTSFYVVNVQNCEHSSSDESALFLALPFHWLYFYASVNVVRTRNYVFWLFVSP